MAPPRKRLGELLVESGLITGEQLAEALRTQKASGKRLGEALVTLGLVTERDIIEVLEFQLGIPQVKLGEYPLAAEVVQTIPEALARRHRAVAVKRRGNQLTVALDDPLNADALDDLRLATGLQIEPVIATTGEVQDALQRFYGMASLGGENALPEQPLLPSMRFNLDQAGGPGGAPVVRVVNTLLQQAVAHKASDIHLEPQEDRVRVRFRVDGMLREITTIPRGAHPSLVSRLKIMAEMDIAEKRLPQDGRIDIAVNSRQVDLRVSTLPTVHGEKVVIRILDKNSALRRLDDLGFQEQALRRYRALVRRPYGMVLVTGPTGSGKTTTLYATLAEIMDASKNIVTVEDPVEYLLPGINQVAVNVKAGLTFASGLRSILRQDPDIVMVGEIRDHETAEMAVRAATTGHLVLSTLHTNDAAGAVTRLVDMGIEPFLVASALNGVVAQRLVRLLCTHCREPYQPGPGSPEAVFLAGAETGETAVYRPRGCSRCGSAGYQGRMAVQEVMILSQRLRELVLAKASSSELRAASLAEGMFTLQQDAAEKARRGLTSPEEVLRVALAED